MQNEYLAIAINSKGSELTSIKSCKTGFEFLWQANPSVWARHAPILFPIVGKVKNDLLKINGSMYPMKQHGFARDSFFELIKKTNTSILYQLTQTAESLLFYPYHFKLLLGYELINNTLVCSYKVVNMQDTPIYFSIGAHPGFNLPSQKLTDYEIVFDQDERNQRHLLTNGLFNGETKPFLTNPKSILLQTSLFDDDAIVLKNINSKALILKAIQGNFGVKLQCEEFKHLGIWTQKGCEQYICLEPWLGFADSIDEYLSISEKPGMITLKPNETFDKSYSLTFTE